MTRQAVIWSLVVACVVGVTALGVGSFYWQQGQDTAVAVDGAGENEVQTGAALDQQVGDAAENGTDTATAPAATQADASDEPVAGVEDTAQVLDESEPSFDVVGVQPTGDAVIAGRSEAGSIVALTANGAVVGKGIADQNGEWTIILEQPLEPGDYDVGLEVQDEAGEVKTESRQRLVVSIPDNGQDQPLVVLNTPDAPSDVLQIPAATDVAESAPETGTGDAAAEAAPEPTEETVVAAVSPTAEEPETSSGESSTTPTPTADAMADTAADIPAETPAAGEQSSATEEPAPTAGATEEQANPSPEAVATAQTEPAVSEPQPAAVEADEPAGETVAAEVEVAGRDAQTEEPAPAQTAQEPVVETDVQDQVTADAAPAPEGSINEDAVDTPAALEQAAAPDPVEPVTSAATQEETQPVEEPAPQVAGTEPLVPTGETRAREADQAVAEAAGAQPPSSSPSPSTDIADKPQVTVDAVESEEGKVFVAGTGEPGTEVRVYVDDEFAGNAAVTETGRWLVEGAEDIPEGDVEVRADLVETGSDEVEARAAVIFEKDTPEQIVLTRVVASGTAAEEGAQTAEVAKPLPNVIIRRGDNLWRISRRLYGQGIRYTTIYQANQDQIRDPDLIYPGQVFLTPQGDVNWPENGTAPQTVVQ